jgi:hypothetical protein
MGPESAQGKLADGAVLSGPVTMSNLYETQGQVVSLTFVCGPHSCIGPAVAVWTVVYFHHTTSGWSSSLAQKLANTPNGAHWCLVLHNM